MSVYDILDRITSDNGYADRMTHKVPSAEVVNRREFILEQIKDKRVVDIGSAGTDGTAAFFKQMAESAGSIYGIDNQSSDLPNIARMDLDRPVAMMPWLETDPEIVVAGEVLEHMTNPGIFLDNLRQYKCPVLLTVPNAFSVQAIKAMGGGIEAVNVDHCCWFSWRTVSTLIGKCRYSVSDWKWYNGAPLMAEGLIFICQPRDSDDAENLPRRH